MKRIFIDSSLRFSRRVLVRDSVEGKSNEFVGEGDLLSLIDEALRKSGTSLKEIELVEAKMEGESRVGVSIGVAAANALSYALELKPLEELEFPNQEADPFR